MCRVENNNIITQYTIIHAEQELKKRIAGLKLALSDQNLELLPDYEQRVDVLKDLRHIDENQTVLLKGRVACEVRKLDIIRVAKCLTRRVDQFHERARPYRTHP